MERWAAAGPALKDMQVGCGVALALALRGSRGALFTKW